MHSGLLILHSVDTLVLIFWNRRSREKESKSAKNDS